MAIGISIGLAFAGSVKPWLPSDLSPVLWLRAGLADVVLTGSDVDQWTDRSGHAHHASDVSASKPEWVASHAALNGQPAIKHNVWHQFVSVAGVEADSDWTVMGVFDVPLLAAGPYWIMDNGATLAPMLQTNSVDQHLGYTANGTGNVDIAEPIAGPQSIVWRFEQAINEGRIYRNGLDLGAGTYPAVSSPIIGAGGGYLMAGSFLAYCSELIFVPRACTAAERAKFAAYSMGRYGV
jgi:hypothetical protein